MTSRWTRITQSAFLIIRSLWALVGVSLFSFVNLYVWGVLCPHSSLNWNYGSGLSLNKMGDTALNCVVCEYLEFELICPFLFFFDEVESIGVLCCVRIIPRFEQTLSCFRESYHFKIASPACSWGEECGWHYDVLSQTYHDKPKSLSSISLWMGKLVYPFLVNIVNLVSSKRVFNCQLFMQTSRSFL